MGVRSPFRAARSTAAVSEIGPRPDPRGPADEAQPGSVVDQVLLDRVRQRLVADGVVPTAAQVAAAVRREGWAVRGDEELLSATRRLHRELVGLGLLEQLVRDPTVTDVLVNAPDEVWIDRGAGLVRAPVAFSNEEAVRLLAQRLVAPSGRRLDDAQPWVDVRLADGTRLHAVLPPVAPRGTTLSLRVLRRVAFSLSELVAAGSLSTAAAAVLRDLIAGRLAFLVSGGTGTGKTTLLSTLLGLVDPHERIILAEDAGELTPAHPHVVRLEARPPNLEGAGAVTLRDLVRQALRMRPDRLIVGDVRGAEVVELLAALNTGHEGGGGTVHANGAAEVPARLEALAAAAGLSRPALHSQLVAGVQAVVHLARGRDGVRRLAEIRVLVPDETGIVQAEPALTCTAGGVTAHAGERRLRALLAARGVSAGYPVAE